MADLVTLPIFPIVYSKIKILKNEKLDRLFKDN
jgi:hypothetical protein